MPKDALPDFIDECYSLSRADLGRIVEDLHTRSVIAQGIWRHMASPETPTTPPEPPAMPPLSRRAIRAKAKNEALPEVRVNSQEEADELVDTMKRVGDAVGLMDMDAFEKFNDGMGSNDGTDWTQRASWTPKAWRGALALVRGK
jgi:hypothetical protein